VSRVTSGARCGAVEPGRPAAGSRRRVQRAAAKTTTHTACDTHRLLPEAEPDDPVPVPRWEAEGERWAV